MHKHNRHRHRCSTGTARQCRRTEMHTGRVLAKARAQKSYTGTVQVHRGNAQAHHRHRHGCNIGRQTRRGTQCRGICGPSTVDVTV
eukprot:scaffold184696_cov24-Tisochrysis_lutea.AAC.1